MSKPNGGQAFPGLNLIDKDWTTQQGMSLRDYFAGQALSAIRGGNWEVGDLVAFVYKVADEMLRVRDIK